VPLCLRSLVEQRKDDAGTRGVRLLAGLILSGQGLDLRGARSLQREEVGLLTQLEEQRAR
jgi:hypothetical protein